MAEINVLTEQDGEYMAAQIMERAKIASPEFTGTPKAPTPVSGTNNTQIATTAFVQQAVVAGSEKVYTPKGAVDTYADLPDSENAVVGDIYQVNSDTVEEGGKFYTPIVVDTFNDLPTPIPTDAIYLVKTGDDGTGTFGSAYDDNSYFIADGTDWALIDEPVIYPNGTDFKYTESGWVAMTGAYDMNEFAKKADIEGMLTSEDVVPVPLSTVQEWFAEPTTP